MRIPYSAEMNHQSKSPSVLFNDKSGLDQHLEHIHRLQLKLSPLFLAIQIAQTLACLLLHLWALAGVFGIGLICQMAIKRQSQVQPDQPSHLLLASWFILLIQSMMAVGLVGTKVGFHLYLISTIPPGFATIQRAFKFKVFQTAIITCFFVICSIWLDDVPPFYPLARLTAHMLLALNVVGVFVLLAAVSHVQAQLLKEAEESLRHIASTDELTGLFNRRSFAEIIERETARSHRNGHQLTLCLCDIDFFKRINDTYGHAAGDHVLRTISQSLRTTLREYDCVARWGGEEFIFLWPDTGVDMARQIAERLRESIAGSLMNFEGHAIAVSMTFGIAQFNASESWPAVVARADEALYRGKAEGRNRVVLG